MAYKIRIKIPVDMLIKLEYVANAEKKSKTRIVKELLENATLKCLSSRKKVIPKLEYINPSNSEVIQLEIDQDLLKRFEEACVKYPSEKNGVILTLLDKKIKRFEYDKKISMPKIENNLKVVTFKMDPIMYEKMEAIRMKLKLSRSDFIRQVLEEKINQYYNNETTPIAKVEKIKL